MQKQLGVLVTSAVVATMALFLGGNPVWAQRGGHGGGGHAGGGHAGGGHAGGGHAGGGHAGGGHAGGGFSSGHMAGGHAGGGHAASGFSSGVRPGGFSGAYHSGTYSGIYHNGSTYHYGAHGAYGNAYRPYYGAYGGYPYRYGYYRPYLYAGYAPYYSDYSLFDYAAGIGGYTPYFGGFSTYPLIAAYGAANNQYLDDTQPQYATPAEQPAQDNTLHLRLTVPEDAEVLFDGTLTTQTGSVRDFVTRALTPGSRYSYKITARYTDAQGKVVEDTRDVRFQANDWFSIDFTRPPPAQQAPAPAAQPLPRAVRDD